LVRFNMARSNFLLIGLGTLLGLISLSTYSFLGVGLQLANAVTPSATSSPPALLDPPDGEQLGNLFTTLRWENPSGTTQYHLQVSPWNNDGPGIDLIIGNGAEVAKASYTVQAPQFGSGNYVMLPGATYTWRVRASDMTTSIGTNDPAWGPWSATRTFITLKPDAATIHLISPVDGSEIDSKTPALLWSDSDAQNFYYEVQLSTDPFFGMGPDGAIASVYWNLVHGGATVPPNSWSVPSNAPLNTETYYWRVRQRLQGTPKGDEEPGVPWGVIHDFRVG